MRACVRTCVCVCVCVCVFPCFVVVVVVVVVVFYRIFLLREFDKLEQLASLLFGLKDAYFIDHIVFIFQELEKLKQENRELYDELMDLRRKAQVPYFFLLSFHVMAMIFHVMAMTLSRDDHGSSMWA